jgi:hypothetical protein
MNANNLTATIAGKSATLARFTDGPTPVAWEEIVKQLVSTLRFGVVQITVHESHVVQVRFAQPSSPKSNG